MKNNGSLHLPAIFVVRTLSVICLAFGPLISQAQSPANFSGIWIQDTTESDGFYKKFDVVYTITQTAQTFKVVQKLSDYGGKESVSRNYTYNLDGKEINIKKETGVEKNLAQWSGDRKILNTRSTIKYGPDDVGFIESYSLSDNGLVLTVKKSDIIPGGLSLKQVFNRKK